MNGKKNLVHVALCLIILLSFQPVWAQGFAGLGTSVEGYEIPQPGRKLIFPRDHGAHPNFRIEWWYLTSNLTGEDGRDYGVQWTLFRTAIRPPAKSATENEGSDWSSPQLWMGHAAVTSVDQHFVSETRARGGIGVAGVNHSPFNAWINDWDMRASKTAGRGISDLKLKAVGSDFAYSLNLTAQGSLIEHGTDGYSVKSAEGHASHYYSQPFYEVGGEITLPTGVVKVKGSGWLDREWSSQPLGGDQKGWDWISLNFNDGSKLMGFSLRQNGGSKFTSATWISEDGIVTKYGDGVIKMQPLKSSHVDGRMIPTAWRVQLPDKKLDVEVSVLNPNAWMATSVPYWEGPVQISGSHSGSGYLEMTGYPKVN